MAESQNDAQEKTERPTPKRLQDARKKGQIPRSRELSTMFILFGGALTVYLSAGHFFGGLGDIMRQSFTLEHAALFDPMVVPARLQQHIGDAIVAMSPVLVAATIIALLSPIALGGWTLSAEALAPKFERIDPIKGLKRVFGPKGLMELAKALAKFVLILGFSVVALNIERESILSLGLGEADESIALGGGILFFTFLLVSAATIIVAFIDVPFQLWQHTRQLRMSHKELKDEMKETEGAPELKGKIRNMQQEVARRRMMEEIPNADVIVTNPEHYACALKFDPQTMSAPVLVAKGVDEIAANIRAVGESHGITIFSAPPLARAVFHTTKLNQEIPAALYVAVARVLAYVFQVRDGVRHAAAPFDLPIPDDYQF